MKYVLLKESSNVHFEKSHQMWAFKRGIKCGILTE